MLAASAPQDVGFTYNNGRAGNDYPNNNGRTRDNYPGNNGRTRDNYRSENGGLGNDIPDNTRYDNNLPNQRPANSLPGNRRVTRNYEPIDRSGADARENRTYDNTNTAPRENGRPRDIATPRENAMPRPNPGQRYSTPDPRINNSQRPDVNSRIYSRDREMQDRPVRMRQERPASPSPGMFPQPQSRPSNDAVNRPGSMGVERPQRQTGPVIRGDNGNSGDNVDIRPRRGG